MADGGVAVVYHDDGAVRVAIGRSGTWTTTKVTDSDGPPMVRVAFDGRIVCSWRSTTDA